MWICAKCGTQAYQVEVCSGCGCIMNLPEDPTKPPPPKTYQFVLVVTLEDKTLAAFGPFESVMAADQWQDAHFKRVTSHVMLMTHPDAPV
jgi:hypothetical protein